MSHSGIIGRAKNQRRYYYRQKEKGLCVNCHRKVKKGYANCKYHLKKAAILRRKNKIKNND